MQNTLLFSKDLCLIQMWLMSLTIDAYFLSPFMYMLQGSHTRFIRSVL